MSEASRNQDFRAGGAGDGWALPSAGHVRDASARGLEGGVTTQAFQAFGL